MKIEIKHRGEDAILSFKAENAAEVFQLEYLLLKAEANHLDVFHFAGWEDEGGGISFITKVKQPSA